MSESLGVFESMEEMISRTSSLEELFKSMCKLVEVYGLKNITYVAGVSQNGRMCDATILTTYSQDWRSRYVDNDYHLIDPVHRRATIETVPFDWQDIAQADRRVQNFFGEAKEFGVGSQGLSFPLRGPLGDKGILTATADVASWEWKKAKYAYLRDLNYLSQRIHCKAGSLIGVERKRSLSAREEECVLALTEGLSFKQVAFNLGITQSAVSLYVANAKRKLECKTLNQLVATVVDRGHLLSAKSRAKYRSGENRVPGYGRA